MADVTQSQVTRVKFNTKRDELTPRAPVPAFHSVMPAMPEPKPEFNDPSIPKGDGRVKIVYSFEEADRRHWQTAVYVHIPSIHDPAIAGPSSRQAFAAIEELARMCQAKISEVVDRTLQKKRAPEPTTIETGLAVLNDLVRGELPAPKLDHLAPVKLAEPEFMAMPETSAVNPSQLGKPTS